MSYNWSLAAKIILPATPVNKLQCALSLLDPIRDKNWLANFLLNETSVSHGPLNSFALLLKF